jgi:hypothetical protein
MLLLVAAVALRLLHLIDEFVGRLVVEKSLKVAAE